LTFLVSGSGYPAVAEGRPVLMKNSNGTLIYILFGYPALRISSGYCQLFCIFRYDLPEIVDFFFGLALPFFFRALMLLTSEFLTPSLFFFPPVLADFFGAVFFADFFDADFFADFFGEDFLADFFGEDFLADFFGEDFLADFFAADFLAPDFFANLLPLFFAADFLPAVLRDDFLPAALADDRLLPDFAVAIN
jgi:hypothetical protein